MGGGRFLWVGVCVCVQVLTFRIVFISLGITHVHRYLIMYTYIKTAFFCSLMNFEICIMRVDDFTNIYIENTFLHCLAEAERQQ